MRGGSRRQRNEDEMERPRNRVEGEEYVAQSISGAVGWAVIEVKADTLCVAYFALQGAAAIDVLLFCCTCKLPLAFAT